MKELILILYFLHSCSFRIITIHIHFLLHLFLITCCFKISSTGSAQSAQFLHVYQYRVSGSIGYEYLRPSQVLLIFKLDDHTLETLHHDIWFH